MQGGPTQTRPRRQDAGGAHTEHTLVPPSEMSHDTHTWQLGTHTWQQVAASCAWPHDVHVTLCVGSSL